MFHLFAYATGLALGFYIGLVVGWLIVHWPKTRNTLMFIYSDPETPERREAREAAEKFALGQISLHAFLNAQPPGFRMHYKDKEYLNGFDHGPMVKDFYPVHNSQGTAIGQEGLPSQSAYNLYLEKLMAGQDTEPVVVVGDSDNYRIYDGHHRHQAYKDAGRTVIPVWRPLHPASESGKQRSDVDEVQ